MRRVRAPSPWKIMCAMSSSETRARLSFSPGAQQDSRPGRPAPYGRDGAWSSPVPGFPTTNPTGMPISSTRQEISPCPPQLTDRDKARSKSLSERRMILRLGDLTPTTGGTSVTISAYIDRNKGEASQTIVAPASLGTYITPLPKSLSRDAEERLIKEASRSAGVEVLPVEEVVKRMPHENDKTDNETPKVRAWLTSQGSTRAPVVYKTVESGEFRMSWPISEDAAVLSFPIVIVDGSWHPTTGRPI